jgi:hypothetical protein
LGSSRRGSWREPQTGTPNGPAAFSTPQGEQTNSIFSIMVNPSEFEPQTNAKNQNSTGYASRKEKNSKRLKNNGLICANGPPLEAGRPVQRPSRGCGRNGNPCFRPPEQGDLLQLTGRIFANNRETFAWEQGGKSPLSARRFVSGAPGRATADRCERQPARSRFGCRS